MLRITLAAVLAGTLPACRGNPAPSAGAVVLSCEPGLAGARAGLVPGDTITGWRRGESGGDIHTPFDLARVEQAEAPLGPVTLHVRRGWRTRRVTLPPDPWKVTARPVLPPPLLERCTVVLELEESGKPEEATEAWEALAELAAPVDPGAAAWFRLEEGIALAAVEGDREEALTAFETGAGLLEPALRPFFWERAGDALLASGQRKVAGVAFERALELTGGPTGESPVTAHLLLQLCRSGRHRNEEEARAALRIYRGIEGEGLQTAMALLDLARCLYVRSRYDDTEKAARGALVIVEERSPDSALLPVIVDLLGLAALMQGEVTEARALFARELAAAERIEPAGPRAGFACNHLGLAAKALGDYQAARGWYLRALEIFRRCRPGGVEVAGMLNNLGNLAMKQDDFQGALRYHEQALAIRERLHPGGMDVAASLNNLGLVERQLDHLDSARRHLERSLQLKRRRAPGSITLSNTLLELGMVAGRQGRFEEASRLYSESRAIREKIAPSSAIVADVLIMEGVLARERGDPREAERLWREAVSKVEKARERFGLSEDARSRFDSRYYLLYGMLARLLAREGRGEEGFALMERARCRALRAALQGAHTIPAGVPGRLWTSYRRVLRRIDRLGGDLARSFGFPGRTDGEPGRIEELRQLEETRQRLEAEILATAPRLGGLLSMTGPTLDEVRKTLEPGTVLLSWVVGETDTTLFVVGSAGGGDGGLRTYQIPAGLEELERRVEILNAFIARGARTDRLDRALVVQGRALFELLLGPAMKDITAARRLVLVPDGPLRRAPFSALALPGEELRFLGTWKPLCFNPSAGAFLALRARRREAPRRDGSTLVAFGDPVYPASSAVVRELGLEPLAASRDEVERIAAGFGNRARVWFGREASEHRIRELHGRFSYLHLAVHAHADTRFPLQSALYLSIPGGTDAVREDDGVLHAWEIMDELRFPVRVVTLSGCSTGQGERVAGEGILGLARAFQYAGASTVVASQWPVGDRATAELMTRFYAGLREGLGTAEALRVAQEELAAAPLHLEGGKVLDARHPFHWAGFRVNGDWR